MTARGEHPDWNELAALVDGGAAGAPAGLLEHLAGCPDCLAAWAAAVEHRDRELAVAAAAADLAATTTPAVAPAPGPSPVPPRVRLPAGRSRLRGLRPVAWGAGGLAAAALLLFLLLPRGPIGPSPGGPEQELLRRLGDLSRTGLVYPRVDRLAPAPVAQHRAGSVGGDGPDLAPWAGRFAADPGDEEAAFWLAAGHLAGGQLDLAEDVLRRALRRSPRARELRQLAAIAAYRRSDLGQAEQELRAVLDEDPDDSLARFNLAEIACETGRREEARASLVMAAADSSRPALQTRARQLLEQLDER